VLHRRTLLRATVLAAFIRTFRGERGAFAQEKKESASEPELITLTERGEPILYGEKGFPMKEWVTKSEGDISCFVAAPEQKGWYIDWDCERQELKFLVVHHTATANATGTPEERRRFLTYLSELERDRLYRPIFEKEGKSPYVFGLPIHSGHVLGGEGETFEPYHHLIYDNGDLVTRLVPYRKVEDKYLVDMIGWQAGNWPVNCSSVAVALVGNYETTAPPAVVIERLDKLVAYYRKLIPAIEIRSHKEVKLDPKGTACPGSWYKEWVKKYKK
jgi:hypothetical protein